MKEIIQNNIFNPLTKNILIVLVVLCSCQIQLSGQSISNITKIHSKVFYANEYDDINFIEGDEYNYLTFRCLVGVSFTEDSGTQLFNDSLLWEYANPNPLRWSEHAVLKLDKSNELVNVLKYTASHREEEFYHKKGYRVFDIYYKDSQLYVFGTTYGTDSILVNDEFVEEVDWAESFVHTYDDELNIVDEFYFGNKKVRTELNKILVKDGIMHLAGKFWSNDGEINDHDLEIGDVVLSPQLPTDYYLSNNFYVTMDVTTKKIGKHHVFGNDGSQNGIEEMKMDEEENIFIMCKGEGDRFKGFGESFNDDNAYFREYITMCITKDDSVNYIVKNSASNPQLLVDDTNDLIIESGTTKVIDTLHIGEKKILVEQECAGVAYIARRDISGETMWYSLIKGCYPPGGSSSLIHDIQVDDQGDIWIVGYFNAGDIYFNDTYIDTMTNVFSGFMIKVDPDNGDMLDLHYFKNKENGYVEIHKLIPLGDDKFKVLMDVISFEYEDNVKVFDKEIDIVNKSSLVIFDLDFKGTSIIEEDINNSSLIFPNPMKIGDALGCDDLIQGKLLELIDMNGRSVWQGCCGDSIDGILGGVYILRSISDSNITVDKFLLIN